MWRQPHFSIRSALLFVVLLSLAPAFLIVLATGAEHGKHLEIQAEAEALRQAAAFSEIQARVTESTRQILATLAALPEIEAGRADRAVPMLKAVHGINRDYLNITLTDKRGIVTASSLLEPGEDLGNRPHIRNALAKGRFCAGEYVVGLIEDTPSFAYAYPIRDGDGNIVAVLTALYKLSSYGHLFDSFDLAPDSFLGLVDGKGVRLFFHPPRDTNPVGQAIRQGIWSKITAGGDTGSFLDVGSDGKLRFYGYKKLYLEEDGEPYMTVVFGVPRAEVIRESLSITRRNLAALVLAAAAALFIASGLSQLLFGRRLSRIMAMAARVREGDLEAQAGLEGDDSDLGRIAGALDGMARAVRKRNEELKEEARRLNQLVEEKDVLLREVHHRVKNNLQMTQSLIRLHQGSEGVDDSVLKSLESRITAISMVHEMLYDSESFTKIDLSDYCTRLLGLLRMTGANDAAVRIDFRGDAVHCPLDKAVPFGLLLCELATNSFKYAFRDGGVLSVRLDAEDGWARLVVADDGPGFPEGFRLDTPGGLGLSLVQALVHQLEGEIILDNFGGARFSVRFPLPASCA